MEWIKSGLLALAIGLPALLALMLLLTASRLTRLRLRRSLVSTAGKDDMPDQVRQTLDKAQPFLTELGFQYRYSTASDRSVEMDGDPHVFSDVYEHADGRAHAFVTPSMTPEQGEPCTIMWVTLLRSGKVLATLNCYLHNMISAPAGWDTHDDYLSDLYQVWEHHRQRLSSLNEEIEQDAVEFFRANKLATEQLMAHCEKQGLVVRRDDHWQMPWRAALPFAWKLFLGQRKAAKARSRDTKRSPMPAPSPGNGVEADIEAFQHQLAVQRAIHWSSQKKFKVFLLTAALFLGLGSLWISWTFLPILLVVIGLHEGGHYLAMKVSGYRNLSVFFVPGLGGLAIGEKASASPWEKLFVYLAGPMPGIALAVAGLIGQFTGAFQPPLWFQEFLLACLIINYLNLLPITPLDGGRVVETFLFARLPVARFLFAVLGVAAFLAYGLSTGDTVILVIGVLVSLSLPHQWRVMRVDRAIARHGSETLDERGAIERVFRALQHPAFAGWPFATRAAAATALLPELQGRRAGAIEAAGGITIYLACLLVPPAAAMLAVPQFGAIAAAVRAGYNMVADDVDPEPTRQQVHETQRDWYAEAARVESLPESQRLQVLLGAVDFAAESRNEDKLEEFLKAAWAVAEKRPIQDYDRARTLLAMARENRQSELRRKWREQVATELEGLRDKRSLLLLAEAKEGLAWEEQDGGVERIALMRQVLAHRQEALPSGHHDLIGARLSLAKALDGANSAGEAEALLRGNVESIAVPAATDRSREALYRRTQGIEARVQLAWFLNAHGRADDSIVVLEAALAVVPTKITMSWEHPNRQLREAYLWANLQKANARAVKESWVKYEESRRGIPWSNPPPLMHEVDRFIVARATGDESLKAQALASILESLKSSQGKYGQARLCEEHESSQHWRSKQRKERIQSARLAGVCEKA